MLLKECVDVCMSWWIYSMKLMMQTLISEPHGVVILYNSQTKAHIELCQKLRPFLRHGTSNLESPVGQWWNVVFLKVNQRQDIEFYLSLVIWWQLNKLHLHLNRNFIDIVYEWRLGQFQIRVMVRNFNISALKLSGKDIAGFSKDFRFRHGRKMWPIFLQPSVYHTLPHAEF